MKPSQSEFERIRNATQVVTETLNAAGAQVAVVLGSGLSGVSDRLANSRAMPYAAIPGFPETTVTGHPGRLLVGQLGGRKTLVFSGRVHAYEGYPPSEVGFGVRLAAALGARTLIVTNASGGVDPSLRPGEIVAISDHLNLTGRSPLIGANDERLGPRFVDMTETYSPRLRGLAADACARPAPDGLGYPLREAVYAGVMGPAYETPAEIRMLRTCGAGLVGMSTVFEVITGRHAGMEILGLSLVANHAAGVHQGPLRHEDVTRVAAAGAKALATLVEAVVASLPAIEPGENGGA